MNLASLQRSLGLLLWGTLVAAVVMTSLGERRVDLWWQLPQGLSILATHHLPDQAPAAFGLPSRPFIDEYGLYEIALALLDRLGGLGAIHLAFSAIYLSIFLVPLLAAGAVRRDWISAALLALAALFLINRYEQRPELAGVLLLTALVALLRRTRDFSAGFLFRIALLFAVWTNVHSSYVIGLLALLLWLAERVGRAGPGVRWSAARTGLTLAVAVGALLINPYGARRIVFTFAQENDLGSNLLSREMWPVWDQPPGTVALMVVTGAVLGLVAAGRPAPSRWLLALAGGLFLLTLWHFRHMSFLAVPLLFLSAEPRPAGLPGKWAPVGLLVLGASCVVTLLFDALAARSAWDDLTTGDVRANRGFAPGLFQDAGTGAVLCHDAEGSFLSFQTRGLFPLIDSGQGRFDDATKRFYFFVVEDPYAFDRAIGSLPGLDEIVVTPPVQGWTLAMIHRPGWYLAGIDPYGLLFRRLELHGLPLKESYSLIFPAQAAQLAALRDQAVRDHDIIRAFSFSVLADRPADSLALLDRSKVSAWSEAFFSFARVWIRSLDPHDVADFLKSSPQPANTLLREIILARLAPDAPLPAPESSELGQLARVLTLLERNDFADAHALFSTLRAPKVSPLYYTLRDKLDPTAARRATAAERWQDWNAGGAALFDQLAPRIDARARAFVNTVE